MNAVYCGVCRQKCLIPEGRTGICGVRKNEQGQINLLVYGKTSALNVDPIEKKPLYHMLPGSQILSLGSIGCNFHCSFCQNWEISQATNEPELKGKIPLIDASPESIVNQCLKRDIPSIAFTYNEPTILLEYALDTFALAKEKGLKTVFVSNGYASDASLERLHGLLDAINIDLKAFTESFYRTQCKARLEPVKESIISAFNMGFWLELTTLLIPGLNDSDQELTEAAQWIAALSTDIPWHLTAFHPDYKLLDKKATPLETLERAWQIAKKAGIKYVYAGNRRNPHENTLCPSCGQVLIERQGFCLLENNLKKGACPKCHTVIPGIF